MRRTTIRISLAIATFASFASAIPAFAGAKIIYSAYEGKPVIRTGEGGSKLAKNGIDYWTSGEPPRRYLVIGTIEDKRDEMWDGGHAIGSPSIAEKVKKAGGNAVIIQSEDEAGHGGSYGSASGGLGFLFSGGSKTVTKMVVVKYLSDEPVAPAH